MRNWFPPAAAALLAACGSSQPASDTSSTATPEPGATMVGRYEVVDSKGTKFGAVLDADGSYRDIAADGGTLEQGSWEARAADRLCFHPEGQAQPVTCYTLSELAEDGTQTATPDNGTPPLTVKKVE